MRCGTAARAAFAVHQQARLPVDPGVPPPAAACCNRRSARTETMCCPCCLVAAAPPLVGEWLVMCGAEYFEWLDVLALHRPATQSARAEAAARGRLA